MSWPELSRRARPLLPLAAAIVLAFSAAAASFELAGDMREGDIDRFDEGLLVWLTRFRSPALTELFLNVTALGSWPVIVLLTFGTCTAMLLVGERRFAITLAVTLIGTGVLSSELKRYYGRARPSVVPSLEVVTDASYPSAHTVAAVALFVTIALLSAAHLERRALRLFLVAYALFIATLVAVSRVYLGVHYPSDVAGGALLGIACSLCAAMADRLLGAWSEARVSRRTPRSSLAGSGDDLHAN